MTRPLQLGTKFEFFVILAFSNIFIYWHPLTSPGLSWPYGPLLAFLACVSHLISLRFSRSLDDFTSFLFYIPMR